ncbi:hypothetical protein Tco_0433495, partial [Tanacetum coccineum]
SERTRHSTDGLRVLVFLMKRAYLGLHNRTALSKDRTELLWKLLVLCSSLRKLHCSLWAEAVATACYEITSKTTNLRNEITRFQQRFDESFYEAWDRFTSIWNNLKSKAQA